MATIASIAAEYRMQPHELEAFGGPLLDGIGQSDELPERVEQELRDVLDHTEDGVYRA